MRLVLPGQFRPPPGFRVGVQSIQPLRTIIVDISGDEEQVLNRMKQKTRYNIRLALKKGVVTYPSSDLDVFYQMMQSPAGAMGLASTAWNIIARRMNCFTLTAIVN